MASPSPTQAPLATVAHDVCVAFRDGPTDPATGAPTVAAADSYWREAQPLQSDSMTKPLVDAFAAIRAALQSTTQISGPLGSAMIKTFDACQNIAHVKVTGESFTVP